ncbi:MAG: hypothetical protein WAX80_00435, partial [Minisyncoccia bacterium]
VIGYLPFLPEHRWLFAICGLTLLIAPLSILMDWMIWKYNRHGGGKELRYWNYMPIQSDYYKTSINKNRKEGIMTESWEEEGVESTRENLHSDALLNISALLVFIVVGAKWAYESGASYGWFSSIFFAIISLWITAAFLDRSVFSWVRYLEQKIQR